MGPILEVNKPVFIVRSLQGLCHLVHTDKSHIVHVNGINISGRAKRQSKKEKKTGNTNSYVVCNMQAEKGEISVYLCGLLQEPACGGQDHTGSYIKHAYWVLGPRKARLRCSSL